MGTPGRGGRGGSGGQEEITSPLEPGVLTQGAVPRLRERLWGQGGPGCPGHSRCPGAAHETAGPEAERSPETETSPQTRQPEKGAERSRVCGFGTKTYNFS